MIAIRRRKSAHCFKVVGGFIKEVKCSARDARNIKRFHVNTESFSHQLSDDCAKASITPFTRCCKQKVGSVFWTKSAKAITLNYSDWLIYDIVFTKEKKRHYMLVYIFFFLDLSFVFYLKGCELFWVHDWCIYVTGFFMKTLNGA